MYVQDIEHMLFNWYEIKNFWFDVAHLWNSKFNYIDKFVPDVFVITFAILNNVTASRDLNCLILYGKEFICVAKKKSKHPSVQDFQKYVLEKCKVRQDDCINRNLKMFGEA